MLPLRDHLPTRSVAYVNYALIIANLIVFGLEFHISVSGGNVEEWLTRWSLVPSRFVAHPGQDLPTLFTHMFLHGGAAHVAGNMLYLGIFGDNVEDVLGHVRYFFFYLLCGLCAAFAQLGVSHSSDLPMLGASGAIAGVLAAYAVCYPMSIITVLNPIPVLWFFWGLFLYFPAWLVILPFFVANVINSFTTQGGGGGVAFVAHVGGFIAGLILLPLLRKHDKEEYEPWEGWRRSAAA